MMQIIHCEQLSPEWFEHRIGSIGGSSISAVCAKGKGKSRATLLYRLAGEILSGEKYEGYSNQNMEDGIKLEPEARELYSLITGNEVETVGLIKPDKGDHKHVSPDGLVDTAGAIEIKCVIPSTHVRTIDEDKIPSEYIKQIQWLLGITERQWCDFISYCPAIVDNPMWIKRMERDESVISKIDSEADSFIEDLLKVVRKVKNGN